MQTVTLNTTMTITASVMQITTPNLPEGKIGQPYSFQMQASGGVPPYKNWGASGLPAGLGINSASGVVSGTPSGPVGTTNVSYTVSDSEP